MARDILMPQMGQAMVSGVILEWHVANGAAVLAGEPLLTLETDKTAFEIPAPASGRVRHLVAAGGEADVGSVVGRIASGQEDDRPGRVRATPKARALANGRIDLTLVKAGGSGGVIGVGDVERHLAREGGGDPGESKRTTAISSTRGSAVDRLQRSWRQAPHFVQMIDVNATRLIEAQALIKTGALAATLNDIFLQAAADTMADFPDMNIWIDGDRPVANADVSVSLAVATDRGLRTPIVHGAQGLGLEELARHMRAAIADTLAGQGAGGRASLTVSNLGRYGVRAGTPVLNLDEPVLIFVGAITERAVVVDCAIIARAECTLSIAYDHRIVDGLRAAEFSTALRGRLENFPLKG